ncbi:anti-repressor SinI family protein [Bacillus sp. V3B]|nr:anti-repressor SinI family protein [Bacillus sp. V3B]MCQ6277198.1 anti-repressor SinI family protein [Bacillus sp. V3B]
MGTRNSLDLEWKLLIVEAKNLGLTVQEIRDFLYSKNKETHYRTSRPLLN